MEKNKNSAVTVFALTSYMGSIRRFVYKALIGKDEYPEGCGKTAKEAKQKAALLAWRQIEDQLQSHSQVREFPLIEPTGQRDMATFWEIMLWLYRSTAKKNLQF